MTEEKPIYCGNAREFSTRSGAGMRLQVDLGQFREAYEHAVVNDLIWEWTGRDGTEHRMMNLAALPLREPTEKRTHCIKLDTWKPDPSKRKEATGEAEKPGAMFGDGDDDGVPADGGDGLPW